MGASIRAEMSKGFRALDLESRRNLEKAQTLQVDEQVGKEVSAESQGHPKQGQTSKEGAIKPQHRHQVITLVDEVSGDELGQML